MLDPQKMTVKSQEAIQAGLKLAESNRNPTYEPEHLILELLLQDDGIVPQVLEAARLPLEKFERDLRQRMDKFPQVSGTNVRVGASQALLNLFRSAETESA